MASNLASVSSLRLEYGGCLYCHSPRHKTHECWRTHAYVYGLIDPRDNLFHYVGRTIEADLTKRLSGHFTEAGIARHGGCPSGGRRKNDWINKLEDAAQKPIITLLERVDVKDLTAERRWIRKLARSHPLTNLAHMPKRRRLP